MYLNTMMIAPFLPRASPYERVIRSDVIVPLLRIMMNQLITKQLPSRKGDDTTRTIHSDLLACSDLV